MEVDSDDEEEVIEDAKPIQDIEEKVNIIIADSIIINYLGIEKLLYLRKTKTSRE